MQRSTTNINYKPDRGGTAGLVCRNRPAWGWKPWKMAGCRGCITSTPKSVNFSHFWQKTPKNERGFCIPRPKIAERPYLASWKHGPV